MIAFLFVLFICLAYGAGVYVGTTYPKRPAPLEEDDRAADDVALAKERLRRDVGVRPIEGGARYECFYCGKRSRTAAGIEHEQWCERSPFYVKPPAAGVLDLVAPEPLRVSPSFVIDPKTIIGGDCYCGLGGSWGHREGCPEADPKQP